VADVPRQMGDSTSQARDIPHGEDPSSPPAARSAPERAARELQKPGSKGRPGWRPQVAPEGRKVPGMLDDRQVLIVEDEVGLRRSLASYLESRGVHVSQAGSLAEAKPLLDQFEFDAIVLDVGLPDGDGLGLLKRSTPERVLVITANPDPVRFHETGVLHHLAKPIDLPEFVREICTLSGD
jgi:CheY-like chemotaxis protein